MLLAISLLTLASVTVTLTQDFNYINVRVERQNKTLEIGEATELIIEQQYVPVLSNTTFKDLPNLKYIRLTEDNIETIQSGSFGNLPKLRIINLNYNKIREILYGVFNYVPITNLHVSGNGLRYIQINAFDNMANLEVLDLSHNYLEQLKTGMFLNTKRLKKIILNNNNLKYIPMRMFEHAFLMVQPNEDSLIDLSDNQIESVNPLAFRGVRNVRTLLLNGNKIYELHGITFSQITYMEDIDLSDNLLQNLERAVLGSLRICKSIGVAHNDFNCEFVYRYLEWTVQNHIENTMEAEAVTRCNEEIAMTEQNLPTTIS